MLSGLAGCLFDMSSPKRFLDRPERSVSSIEQAGMVFLSALQWWGVVLREGVTKCWEVGSKVLNGLPFMNLFNLLLKSITPPNLILN